MAPSETRAPISMLPSQTEYLAYLKAGRQPGALEEAKAVDKQSHATLNALRAQQSNMQCFDCTSVKPGWAVLPFGVFVCIDCAQCHRHLGRHISQTKAINTGTYVWFEPEIAVMQNVGNVKAAKAFQVCNLPAKPSRDATSEEKMKYARLKYDGTIKPDWSRAMNSVNEVAPLGDTMAAPMPSKPAPLMCIVGTKTGLAGAMRCATPSANERPARPVSPPNLISFDEPIEATTMAHTAPVPAVQIMAMPVTGVTDEAFFAQFGL